MTELIAGIVRGFDGFSTLWSGDTIAGQLDVVFFVNIRQSIVTDRVKLLGESFAAREEKSKYDQVAQTVSQVSLSASVVPSQLYKTLGLKDMRMFLQLYSVS